MEAVGYDMYLKLLGRGGGRGKGRDGGQPTAECLVDIAGARPTFPESYIPSASASAWRSTGALPTSVPEDDLLDVTDELIDRFGEPPASVKGLIDVALLRNTAAALGIHEVTQKENSLLLSPTKLDMELCGKLASAFRGRVMVNAGSAPYIAFKMLKGQQPIDALREILTAAREAATAESD